MSRTTPDEAMTALAYRYGINYDCLLDGPTERAASRAGRHGCYRGFIRRPTEKHDSGAHVANQEEERVIGAEDNGLFGHAHGGGLHGDTGGGGGFGPLL